MLFVDLVDGNEEILTVGSDRRNGAVDEPDEIPMHSIAGDVADEIDVVEYDQRPTEGAGEADVGGQWVGRGEVPDRAISVDIALRGRNRRATAVYHAAEIGDATADGLRPRREDGQQQQCEGEQQEFEPPAARPRFVRVAGSHLRPRSLPTEFVTNVTEAATLWTGFRRCSSHGTTVPLRLLL